MDLKEYADWNPKAPTGKTTEDWIQKHARDARVNIEGDKKMKHCRIAGDSIPHSIMFIPITKRQPWLWERPNFRQIQNLIEKHLNLQTCWNNYFDIHNNQYIFY